MDRIDWADPLGQHGHINHINQNARNARNAQDNQNNRNSQDNRNNQNNRNAQDNRNNQNNQNARNNQDARNAAQTQNPALPEFSISATLRGVVWVLVLVEAVLYFCDSIGLIDVSLEFLGGIGNLAIFIFIVGCCFEFFVWLSPVILAVYFYVALNDIKLERLTEQAYGYGARPRY